MSGAQVLWQEQGPPLGDDDHLPLPVRVPCQACPQHEGPHDTVLPDRIAVRLCASRALESSISSSTMQKPPSCRLQQEKKRVILAIPKMDPSPPPSFIVVGSPRRFARGLVGLDSPHGTPKNGKIVLTLWLVREQVTSRIDPVLTRGISLRICSVDWFHIRGRYLTAQDVIPTRDCQGHQWLVVNRVLLESARRSY